MISKLRSCDWCGYSYRIDEDGRQVDPGQPLRTIMEVSLPTFNEDLCTDCRQSVEEAVLKVRVERWRVMD